MGDAAESLPDDIDAIDAIRDAVIDWYREEHRPFPWRETSDPYAILVVEVMSQQTQLDRVLDAWEAFLDRWPTVEDLAAADRAVVVGFWTDQRLGYNSRARYLHEAAIEVVEEHGGSVPETPEALEELPGVGPYTANAVASFAFNRGGAVVDTNVKRVLYRAFSVPDSQPAFERAAAALMPEGTSRTWNNAIMEIGGVVCGTTPRCDDGACPLRPWCRAYATGDFTAPDVPDQPAYVGSRRQFRGRAVRALSANGELTLDELGPKVRVDYTPGGQPGKEWLRDLLDDLAADGLVEVEDDDGRVTARLRR